MSTEDLKDFGKKIAEDEDVRNRAKEIGFNPEEIIAYGKELGLDFNEEDMNALAEEVGFREDELTEEQLQMIAGGLSTTSLVLLGGIAAGASAVGAVLGGSAVGTVAGLGALGGAAAAGLGVVGGASALGGLAGVAGVVTSAVLGIEDW